MTNVRGGNPCIYDTYRFWASIAVLFFTIAFAGCGRSDGTHAAAVDAPHEISADAININTASAAELENIPFVGGQLAARIVEHRTRYGAFRKPEHLMLIDGISDQRFRQIRHLIKVE